MASEKWWELDQDPDIWYGFGSREAWEAAYAREHGGKRPGEYGHESWEEAYRNMAWSQEYWPSRHGTQPMTEEVWKSHYYRPADWEDFGQFEQKARNVIARYRNAMPAVQYQPISDTTAGGASTKKTGVGAKQGTKANQFPTAQGPQTGAGGFGVPPVTGIQYPQPIGPQPAPTKPPVNPWALPTTPATGQQPRPPVPPPGVPTTQQVPRPNVWANPSPLEEAMAAQAEAARLRAPAGVPTTQQRRPPTLPPGVPPFVQPRAPAGVPVTQQPPTTIRGMMQQAGMPTWGVNTGQVYGTQTPPTTWQLPGVPTTQQPRPQNVWANPAPLEEAMAAARARQQRQANRLAFGEGGDASRAQWPSYANTFDQRQLPGQGPATAVQSPVHKFNAPLMPYESYINAPLSYDVMSENYRKPLRESYKYWKAAAGYQGLPESNRHPVRQPIIQPLNFIPGIGELQETNWPTEPPLPQQTDAWRIAAENVRQRTAAGAYRFDPIQTAQSFASNMLGAGLPITPQDVEGNLKFNGIEPDADLRYIIPGLIEQLRPLTRQERNRLIFPEKFSVPAPTGRGYGRAPAQPTLTQRVRTAVPPNPNPRPAQTPYYTDTTYPSPWNVPGLMNPPPVEQARLAYGQQVRLAAEARQQATQRREAERQAQLRRVQNVVQGPLRPWQRDLLGPERQPPPPLPPAQNVVQGPLRPWQRDLLGPERTPPPPLPPAPTIERQSAIQQPSITSGQRSPTITIQTPGATINIEQNPWDAGPQWGRGPGRASLPEPPPAPPAGFNWDEWFRLSISGDPADQAKASQLANTQMSTLPYRRVVWGPGMLDVLAPELHWWQRGPMVPGLSVPGETYYSIPKLLLKGIGAPLAETAATALGAIASTKPGELLFDALSTSAYAVEQAGSTTLGLLPQNPIEASIERYIDHQRAIARWREAKGLAALGQGPDPGPYPTLDFSDIWLEDNPQKQNWTTQVLASGDFDLMNTADRTALRNMSRIGATLMSDPDLALPLYQELRGAKSNAEVDEILNRNMNATVELLWQAVGDPLNVLGVSHLAGAINRIPGGGPIADVLDILVTPAARSERTATREANRLAQLPQVFDEELARLGIDPTLTQRLLGNRENFLTQPARFEAVAGKTQDLFQAVLGMADNPEDASRIVDALATGNRAEIDRLAGLYGPSVYDLALMRVGGGIEKGQKPIVIARDVLYGAFHKTSFKDLDELNWAMDMAARIETPILDQALVKAPIVLAGQETNLVKKAGKLYTDLAYAFRTYLSMHALYMRFAYAIRNAVGDTVLRPMDLGLETLRRVPNEEMKAYLIPRGWRPRKTGVVLEQAMVSGPISRGISQLTQKIPIAKTTRNLNMQWEADRYLITSYYAYQKGEAAAKLAVFRSLVNTLPPALKNEATLAKVQGIIYGAADAKAARRQVDEWVRTGQVNLINPLYFLSPDIKLPLMAEGGDLGELRVALIDRLAETPASSTDFTKTTRDVVQEWRERYLQQGGQVGVSGDYRNYDFTADRERDYRILIDDFKSTGQQLGADPQVVQQAIEGAARQLDAAHQGQAQMLWQTTRSLLDQDLGEDGRWLIMQVWKQSDDAKLDIIGRADSKRQEIVDLYNAGRKLEAQGQWDKYFPWAEREFGVYLQELNTIQVNAALVAEQLGPGVKLEDVLPALGDTDFVAPDEFINRHFADAMAQAPIDRAAIEAYRGGRFGENQQAFQGMLTNQRADVRNSYNAMWAAATQEGTLDAFETAINAQWSAAQNWRFTMGRKLTLNKETWAKAADMPAGAAKDALWTAYYNQVDQLMRTEGWANEKRYYQEALSQIQGYHSQGGMEPVPTERTGLGQIERWGEEPPAGMEPVPTERTGLGQIERWGEEPPAGMEPVPTERTGLGQIERWGEEPPANVPPRPMQRPEERGLGMAPERVAYLEGGPVNEFEREARVAEVITTPTRMSHEQKAQDIYRWRRILGEEVGDEAAEMQTLRRMSPREVDAQWQDYRQRVVTSPRRMEQPLREVEQPRELPAETPIEPRAETPQAVTEHVETARTGTLGEQRLFDKIETERASNQDFDLQVAAIRMTDMDTGKSLSISQTTAGKHQLDTKELDALAKRGWAKANAKGVYRLTQEGVAATQSASETARVLARMWAKRGLTEATLKDLRAIAIELTIAPPAVTQQAGEAVRTTIAKSARQQLQQDIRDAAIKLDVESATKAGKPQEQHIIRKWLPGNKQNTLAKLSEDELRTLQANMGAAPPPVVAEKVAEAAPREPWQVTKEEWANVEDAGYPSERYRLVDNTGKMVVSEPGQTKAGANLFRTPQAAFKKRDAMHRAAVKQALQEGKPVPQTVLAQYPDLVGRMSPREKAAAEAAKAAEVTPAAAPAVTETAATDDLLSLRNDADLAEARKGRLVKEDIQAIAGKYEKGGPYSDLRRVTLDNKEAWSNGYIVDLGKADDMAAKWNFNLRSDEVVDATRLIPADKARALTPLGLADVGAERVPSIILTDGKDMVAINRRYYGHFFNKYKGKNVEFRGHGREKPVEVWADGERVGAIMPLRIEPDVIANQLRNKQALIGKTWPQMTDAEFDIWINTDDGMRVRRQMARERGDTSKYADVNSVHEMKRLRAETKTPQPPAPRLEEPAQAVARQESVTPDVGPTAKEPWQMTRGEWATSPLRFDGMLDQGAKNYGAPVRVHVNRNADGTWDVFSEYPNGERDYWGRNLSESSAFDGGRRRTSMGSSEMYKQSEDAHQAHIVKALTEGKDVPAEVLTDYRDLVRQYGKQAIVDALPPNPNQPHTLTLSEYLAKNPPQGTDEYATVRAQQSHEQYVRQALKDNRYVSPSVLADYPDLAAKYGMPPAAAQTPSARPLAQAAAQADPEMARRLEAKRLLDEIKEADSAVGKAREQVRQYPLADTLDDEELADMAGFLKMTPDEYRTMAANADRQLREATAHAKEVSARNLPIVEQMNLPPGWGKGLPRPEAYTGPTGHFGTPPSRMGMGLWQQIGDQWMPAGGGAGPAIPALEQTTPMVLDYLDKLEADLLRIYNDPAIWQQMVGQTLSLQEQQALRAWASTHVPQAMQTVRHITQKVGQEIADFTAGSPQKQYLWDMLLSGIVPYPYWISRQGKNMVQRIATRPGILSQLLRHEREQERIREENNLPARAIGTTLIKLPDGSWVGINLLGMVLPGYEPIIQKLKPDYSMPEDLDGGKKTLAQAVSYGRDLGEPYPWLMTLASLMGLTEDTPGEIWRRALVPSLFKDVRNITAVAANKLPGLGIDEGGWNGRLLGMQLAPINKYDDHAFERSTTNVIVRGLVTPQEVFMIDTLWQDIRQDKMTPEQAIEQYPQFAHVWNDYVDSYILPNAIGGLFGIYPKVVSKAELTGNEARRQRVPTVGEAPSQRLAQEVFGKNWYDLTGDEQQQLYEDYPNLRYQDNMYWLDWAAIMPEAQRVDLDFNTAPDQARQQLAERAFWDVQARIPPEAQILANPIVADVLSKENRDAGWVELGDYQAATALLYAWLAEQQGQPRPAEVGVLAPQTERPAREMVTDYDSSQSDFWDLYYRAKDAGVLVDGVKPSQHPDIAPILSPEGRDAVTPAQWQVAAQKLAEALGETYTSPDLSVRPRPLGDEKEIATAEQRWRTLFRERDRLYPDYRTQADAYKQTTDKSGFYDANPTYGEAQDWLNAQIEKDPLLKKYYGPVPAAGEATATAPAVTPQATTGSGKATEAEVTYAERNGRATGTPTQADYRMRDQIDAQVEADYPGWGALRKQYLAIPVENTDARRAFRDAHPEYERGYDMRQRLLEQYAPALATVVEGQVFYYNGPRAAANRIATGEARFRVPLYQNLRGSEWGGGYGGGGSFRSPIQYRGIQSRAPQPVQWRGIGNVWRLPELYMRPRGM